MQYPKNCFASFWGPHMPKPFIVRDRFAKKAQEQGFLARSAFKLREIQQKFNLIKPGNKVLDLGAAPGSWLQVAQSLVGKEGLIIGIDKEPIKFKTSNVKTARVDILDDNFLKMIAPFGRFDVILSDLAPATSGIKNRDQAQSQELAERALSVADTTLRRDGSLIVKIFQGPETAAFVQKLKKAFAAVHVYKPKASRDRSFETYIVALKKID